jgi:hypothetical protein
MLGLLVLALVLIEQSQIVEASGCVGMCVSQLLFSNCQGALEQQLGLCVLVIWAKSEQVSARRVSSSTIEQLKGRFRGGWLRIVFVNSGGQRRVRLAQNHHQSTPKNERDRLTEALDLPVHLLFLPLFR